MAYTEEPIAEQIHDTTPFWGAALGKVIRWIVYIPIGITLVSLIESLAYWFFIWFFANDMRLFIVIGVLLGGLTLLIPFVMAYVYSIVLANDTICPTPHVGVVIFAVVYVLGAIGSVVSIVTSGYNVATIVTVLLLKLVFLGALWTAVYDIYTDNS